MMVMPLGPDFSRTIGMDASLIGLIGGAYTIAAAVSTILCYRFLDRFNRKRALLLALTGLTITTGLSAFAWSFESLLWLRALAGLFGGPLSALALATITDAVTVERRGRAFGMVMAAFSVAAVVGVPIGLEMAGAFGWPSAFVAVAIGGALAGVLIHTMLPEIITRRATSATALTLRGVISNNKYQLGLSVMFIAIFSIFLLIPHLSAYWQFNRGFPREHLAGLYMAGGVTAFILARLAGFLVDKKGPMLPLVLFTVCLIATTFFTFTLDLALPVFLIFIAYMGLSAARSVPAQTLSSMVPEPHQRAGYMALQSAVQSLGSGTAAILSSAIVSENTDHSLVNLPIVSVLSILSLCLLIYLCHRLTRYTHQVDDAVDGSTG